MTGRSCERVGAQARRRLSGGGVDPSRILDYTGVVPRPSYDEVVLLTGLPSFAARTTCEEIVRSSPKTLVFALIVPKFEAEARDFLDALPMEQRSRVQLVEGDAAAMDLGLSGAELKQLASEVDRIHHIAGVSYLGVDRPTAEHVNVGGAHEIIEFARACRSLKCLVQTTPTALVSRRPDRRRARGHRS